MSTFELIDRHTVPAGRGGHVIAFSDALDAAIEHPERAVKLAGLTQRERSRLSALTSATNKSNKSRYAGMVNVTATHNMDGTYDVYLTRAEASPIADRPRLNAAQSDLSGPVVLQ